MRRLRSTAALVALLTCVGFGIALSGQGSGAAFRAGVDMVALSVTVRNTARQYVDDLNREDFQVFENGVPQTLTFFGKSNVPLGIAFLLDTSASMEQALPLAQEAAIAFARTLRPADLGAVIDFDSTVKTVQGFTHDAHALEAAIRNTSAGGSTALFNAVYIALKELNKLPAEADSHPPRRRAIVVLSDGEDTSSLVDFEDLQDLASRSDTVIYSIGLGQHEMTRGGKPQEGEFVLRRLAEQTGGRAFFPKEARDLATVYADIREELSRQSSLAYESAMGQRDGQWRRISVRVSRPNVLVRTRQGYFAPTK
jgi:Ca-activated chloride channel family protein